LSKHTLIKQENKPIKQAVCDRGYVGANIILPKKALKRDNRYQRDKKRKLCKRRAAIEPIIETAFYPVPQKTLGILQKINPIRYCKILNVSRNLHILG
jgi:hypothetical protein